MVSIEFKPNIDGITTSMFVNNQIVDDEIPFVPNKLVDSRGIALWKLCMERRLNFETDLEFINETWDEKRELKRLFDYMLNPVYVKEYLQSSIKVVKQTTIRGSSIAG